MIKWIAYIISLLIFAPFISSAEINNHHFRIFYCRLDISLPCKEFLLDTGVTKGNKKQDPDESKKIKEVTKAKKQPKPEKIEPADNDAASKAKQKPKRQRRPEGMERPPEIPRRNGN